MLSIAIAILKPQKRKRKKKITFPTKDLMSQNHKKNESSSMERTKPDYFFFRSSLSFLCLVYQMGGGEESTGDIVFSNSRLTKIFKFLMLAVGSLILNFQFNEMMVHLYNADRLVSGVRKKHWRNN
ncbi:hypothetical protein BLOT_002635 [Blomia tropicalis]|nr:hypothetical protein BLOT_002635 [Blomia tropicalis]